MIVLVLGCLLASRYVYLGLYNSEEEAARYNWLQKQSFFDTWFLISLLFNELYVYVLEIRAYDRAVLKCIGREAVTNFDPNSYDENSIYGTNPAGSISCQ